MFGFVSKFKQQVIGGFDAVHQRLVTLEARVDALFHADAAKAATVVTTIEAPVEADAAKVVETVVAAAKQEAVAPTSGDGNAV